MDDDVRRWTRVKQVFQDALERPEDERGPFVLAACGDDRELKGEVESLLVAHAAAGSFAQGPAIAALSPPAAVAFAHSLVPRHIGSYQVLSFLGAGGMGQVYRARDPRLNRDVAIKVSAAQFSERFEREARAIAALNHPNICQIYDVGPNYFVMEYIEGTPLKGPLPVAKALEYAGHIAEALDAAHTKKITHRDLKPANILVTKQGLKLLDFGLAKIENPVAVDQETMAVGLTMKGEILGTLRYMSPEQINGQAADARSDIFSFGLVLHEMLTGTRAFEGSTPASVIAAILERPAPSVSDVAPPSLDRVLKRCLEKNPENRWQTARDLKAGLDLVGQAIQPATGLLAAPEPPKPRRLWPVSIAMSAMAAAGLAFLYLRQPPPPERTLRYTIPAPAKSVVQSLAVSPDGRYIVISAETNGKRQLWLRAMDADDVKAMPDTDGGAYPFWSPDSRFIAFFGQGKLKRIAASGGPAEPICAISLGSGGSWNKDDVILFAAGPSDGPKIQRVPASGGVPLDVLKGTHEFPLFLPDEHHFLYLDRGGPAEKNGIYVASLDAKENRRLLATASSVAFAPPSGSDASSHLFFLRDGALMAQSFDSGSAQLLGDAVLIAPSVGTINLYYTPVTASTNGVLVYFSGGESNQLPQIAWFDQTGKQVRTVTSPGHSSNPAISPDGRTVAFQRASPIGVDIWLRDVARGLDNRLTFDPWLNSSPFWSGKGDQVAFHSSRSGTSKLYQKAVSGSDRDVLLPFSGGNMVMNQWSKDGQFIVYVELGEKGDYDVGVLSTPEGAPADGKPGLFLHTPFNEYHGQLSPDSHWMAYSSDESGEREVYVVPFPAGGRGKQISTAGGEQPRWRADGKELFYLAADRRMMAVQVQAMAGATAFEASAPVVLFETNTYQINAGAWMYQYDVTADGKRFLITTTADAAATPLQVVTNWQAGLKK